MLIIMIVVSLSMSAIIFKRQTVATNTIKSTQAYYAAESGIEDSLLRLKKNGLILDDEYQFYVDDTVVSVSIPQIFVGSRKILASSNNKGIIKNIEVTYAIDGDGVGFNYGAQVGEGGLSMGNGSIINGSIFSSGDINGRGTIVNDAIVAGDHIINSAGGLEVQGNAISHSCALATVGGSLTFTQGGLNTCNVSGGTLTQSSDFPDQPLPLSQNQIDAWKNTAQDGGVINGDYVVINNQTAVLGPVKITGNLLVDNNAILKLTGAIYIQGNVTLGNNAIVQLDDVYGFTSGVLITDGTISAGNNSVFLGSGQSSSYILVLSTSASPTAIIISNNGNGAIFYASSGTITVNNNIFVKEVTGYKVIMDNNSSIEYESGLASAFFSGGPSAGWKVKNWEEK